MSRKLGAKVKVFFSFDLKCFLYSSLPEHVILEQSPIKQKRVYFARKRRLTTAIWRTSWQFLIELNLNY